jgi:tetratricopeptide (TPR) repeat protein
VNARIAVSGALFACASIAGAFQGRVSSWHARIMLEDGMPLTPFPLITVIPGQIGGCRILDKFGSGTVLYSAWTDDSTTTSDECTVEIRLDGYRTRRTTLRNGAVIVLKRTGESEGSMIDAASSGAPPEAKAQYEQGVRALRSKDWEGARGHLEQAIDIYPQYAQALSDLGEALEHQSNRAGAKAAYEKAIAISPKYLKPYAQLAKLAIVESRYADALTITDQAMGLNPVEFPSIYFCNAQAHFELHEFDAAEQSARRAVELDTDHQVPRSLYLLGLLLEQKGDRKGAIEQWRAYVALSPKPSDAAEVKRRIKALRKEERQ